MRSARMTLRGALAALLLTAGTLLAVPQARNVIVMIPDGCGTSVATLARWYTGRPLALDALLCGAVRTRAANSIITCSAAAATAYATGHKTDIGFLSVASSTAAPGSTALRPLATVLEAAKLAGKSVGLVATSTITHATPAAFATHEPDRDMHDEIMRQLVYQDLDVVLGGGRGWLEPATRGGRREDSLDLKQVLLARGCRLVRSARELAGANSTPVWGMFAEEHMCPDADRSRHAPGEPSLAEMTAKAITLLSANPKGFFLMVEGSQVDWGDHANDPFYAVTDFLAFDSAVRVATGFAVRDGRTLVIACPDHNCGGLSIGSATSRVEDVATDTTNLLEPLRRMRLTSTGLVRELGRDRSPANIREQVRQWWGTTFADSELAQVRGLVSRGMDLDHALSQVYSACYTVLGWTSHEHTGEDVPLWAYGPGRPTGVIDNTEVARAVAAAAGLDLAAAGRELFCDIGRPAGTSGIRLDGADATNPVLTLGGYRLPLGTDLLIFGSDTTRLEGITAFSRGNGRAYGPASALAALSRKQ